MNQSDMDIILRTSFSAIEQLMATKGNEYAGNSDRLANFRRQAIALGLRPEQIWAVYAAKHWDAIQSYVKNLSAETRPVLSEPIEGRIDDLLTYLLLFKGMLAEGKGKVIQQEMLKQQSAGQTVGAFVGKGLLPQPDKSWNP